MKYKLHYYGDPILRKKCSPVEEITEEIRDLASAMLDGLSEHGGIGLAAPQYGQLLRLFIVRVDEYHVDGSVTIGEPGVFVNPVLSSPSEEVDVMEEGCLSIPGVRVAVERPIGVTVEATDLEGNRFTKECLGIYARVVMHENDHINGKLMMDRIGKDERSRIQPQLDQIKKRFRS